jgi:hypothetical protein
VVVEAAATGIHHGYGDVVWCMVAVRKNEGVGLKAGLRWWWWYRVVGALRAHGRSLVTREWKSVPGIGAWRDRKDMSRTVCLSRRDIHSHVCPAIALAHRPKTTGQRVSQGCSGVKRGGWGMEDDWVSSLPASAGDNNRDHDLQHASPGTLACESIFDESSFHISYSRAAVVVFLPVANYGGKHVTADNGRWCAALLVSHWSGLLCPLWKRDINRTVVFYSNIMVECQGHDRTDAQGGYEDELDHC